MANPKYTKEIADNICNLIKEDSYTNAEICQKVGISERLFYKWKSERSDFADDLKRAAEDFNALIVVEAKKSLVKLIKGYTVQEKKTVTADTGKKDDEGKPIVRVKEHSVTDKHYQPVTAAVIFALTNRDPDNWKNKMNNELSGQVDVKSNLEKLSDDELEEIINGEN